jgi:serine/threonine protein kinase
MGEVYRATDTRLGRDVAIKVLPTSFAANAQSMARFEREAQLLASLNHPGIASVFGLEESAPICATGYGRVRKRGFRAIRGAPRPPAVVIEAFRFQESDISMIENIR